MGRTLQPVRVEPVIGIYIHETIMCSCDTMFKSVFLPDYFKHEHQHVFSEY